jgi:hypothetical protein
MLCPMGCDRCAILERIAYHVRCTCLCHVEARHPEPAS